MRADHVGPLAVSLCRPHTVDLVVSSIREVHSGWTTIDTGETRCSVRKGCLLCSNDGFSGLAVWKSCGNVVALCKMFLDHPWSAVPGLPRDSAPQKLLQNDLGVDTSVAHELGSFVARKLFAVVHGANVRVRSEVFVELAIKHAVKPSSVGHALDHTGASALLCIQDDAVTNIVVFAEMLDRDVRTMICTNKNMRLRQKLD